MELTIADVAIHKNFFDPATILDPWRWRLRNDFAPLLPTVLGHIFLERTDGTVWFLDTWSGELHLVAGNYEEFRTSMSEDQEFLAHWFMPDLVAALKEAGICLEPGECFTSLVSPGLGGSLSPSNFMPASLLVHMATTAAECQQLGSG